MNNCTIYGRLGKDADFKTTASGTKVLNFSLANNTGYGERKQTNWFRCVMFGERGEKIADMLKKGTAVVVAGEVTLNTWQTQDGTEKSDLSLNVRELSFAGSKPDSDQAASSGGQKQKQAQPKAPLGGPVSFDDDDIPF